MRGLLLFVLGLVLIAGGESLPVYDVIVVGAGASGLAAAKELKENHRTVLVLEAQDRVGGRLRTDYSPGLAFDEGASWIHGPRGNPITALAAPAGLATFLTDNENLEIYDGQGHAYDEDRLEEEYERYQEVLEEIESEARTSESFLDAFRRLAPEHVGDPLWSYMLSAYLEFDSGGDVSKLSARQFADDEKFSGEDVIVTNGYDKLASYLAKGLDIHLNEAVIGVDYTRPEMVVTTKEHTYKARKVICTVPLGVLKAGMIRFVPDLPAEKKAAIAKIQMGVVNKFLLLWDSAFWDEKVQYIGFTPAQKGHFNYFLNLKTFSKKNALMTFAFGDFARETEDLTDDQLLGEILDHLRAIYGPKVSQPHSFLRTRWASQPFTLGAYTYASQGVDTSQFDVLAEPVANRLFFAGEHTSRLFRGTVHGAFQSGVEAAKEILESDTEGP